MPFDICQHHMENHLAFEEDEDCECLDGSRKCRFCTECKLLGVPQMRKMRKLSSPGFVLVLMFWPQGFF